MLGSQEEKIKLKKNMEKTHKKGKRSLHFNNPSRHPKDPNNCLGGKGLFGRECGRRILKGEDMLRRRNPMMHQASW